MYFCFSHIESVHTRTHAHTTESVCVYITAAYVHFPHSFRTIRIFGFGCVRFIYLIDIIDLYLHVLRFVGTAGGSAAIAIVMSIILLVKRQVGKVFLYETLE